MKFFSTNNKAHTVGLREAVLNGLAPDNGLYMPVSIPKLPVDFIRALKGMSFEDMGFGVAKHLFGDDISDEDLKKIIQHTLTFDAPVVAVEEDVYALELFHGPTLAFKDFGARFLSGLLGHFAQQDQRPVNILVATSGDTGSAVAHAFLNVAGTRVIILYPSGKVSEIQEKQFTTLGGNIVAVEVMGTFDDCQRLVKQAFLDHDVKQSFFITSANSINIARLVPQSFYYFYAYAQLRPSNAKLIVSVPSGNFGNLTAGLLAKRMGLPVDKFIAATNINSVVPEFLSSGKFQPRPSQPTISNAMDVGNPSNFVRLLELHKHNFDLLTSDVIGFSFSDDETRQAIRQVSEKSGYIMDPHGAVGYLGLKKFMEFHPHTNGIFLETAHPAKFMEVVEPVVEKTILTPARLQKLMAGKKKTVLISPAYEELKSLLPTLIAQ
jgi:threonine synthase